MLLPVRAALLGNEARQPCFDSHSRDFCLSYRLGRRFIRPTKELMLFRNPKINHHRRRDDPFSHYVHHSDEVGPRRLASQVHCTCT